ncbi:MAG TPA: helix-turn-helix transcriptional regulator [Polyangiaceae bacterium]|jgi:transcriptional regulator with XRE-family HTH domain
MPKKAAANEPMDELVARIRAALIKKGWSQGRLEDEAGFAGGSLTRILSGRQKRVWPQTLHRIARALAIPPQDLAGSQHVLQELGPQLSDLEGYANAEVQVARLEPDIPLSVFEQARKTRFEPPPEKVTPELLHAHVLFLLEHFESGVRVKGTGERRASTKKRRAGARRG